MERNDRQTRNQKLACRKSGGFTLVELLVVIAIIGILVSLLLPAVQAAREAGRRMECSNRLKQLGLAMLEHESAYHHFASGGYGWTWTADPDRGGGADQPGGWSYCILPFIEQQAVYDMGTDGQPDVITAAQCNGAIQRDRTPLFIFICPSRREPKLYPRWRAVFYVNAGQVIPEAIAIDYVANGGTLMIWNTGPATLPGPNFDWTPYTFAANTGISYQRSRVKLAQVTDGTSHTYMLGEKYLNTDSYENGNDPADDGGIYEGSAWDTYRWTESAPLVDTPGTPLYDMFGSAHAGASNYVFCDGSVHSISYEIDLPTHQRLSSRADGLPVDESL
jgi:prepilin-type N-terminal cleavage/methylation domain-containing protein/prepilin-type processing-associated H-X9-DG protein